MPVITDEMLAAELMQEKSRVLAKMHVMAKSLENRGFICTVEYRKQERDCMMTATHAERDPNGGRPDDAIQTEENAVLKLMHQWKKEFEGFKTAISKGKVKLVMVARHVDEPSKNHEADLKVKSPMNPKVEVSAVQAIVEQAALIESGEKQDRDRKKELLAEAKAKKAREKREQGGAPADPPAENNEGGEEEVPAPEGGLTDKTATEAVMEAREGTPEAQEKPEDELTLTDEPEGPEIDEDTGRPVTE
jgi:hypothetical protein